MSDGNDDDGSGTMDHLIIASIAVFIGSIVEGILGFGCSLVWMSFFPLFTSIQDAVGVLQPMHLALNLFIVCHIYKSCTPSELQPLLMTAPFGILFGLWIVTSWSSNAIDCVLGIFLIVYTMIKSKNDDNDNDNNDDEGKMKLKSSNHNNDRSSDIIRKEVIKRKTSEIELESTLDIENDFPTDDNIEEKKDDSHSLNKSPISANIPHAESQLSPLTHRYNTHNNNNSLAVPNLNPNHPAATKTKTTSSKKLSLLSSSNNNNNNNTKMTRNPTAIVAGFVGGALMGAFGTGGPAFLIYAKEAGWAKIHPEVFRANMQLLFFVINVPVIISQYYEGIITFERCQASLYLLPALMLGGHLGGLLATKVPREKFQLLVVNGLRIMGVMFLIEATR
ncbi:hypothetical protein FRACYDRAFT_250582 [Fragilariopsis cylindrus CCMP1102]|uniref:Membrane transporter protein n=1 Tax=Fragilariopsis cylindrus CCMP1102 TaxID=635003 RepID=A0A1E7EPQ9_9STRA|nr:hypothetical protein FRACYDRAFT_250582 [Fragilariopsis cylindrus CCMP1102]|eukprot:OEU07942.1 hypothetical protein FRACYDRAFT_250582 [Fragilariopsis cylindrus CCMP1102]